MKVDPFRHPEITIYDSSVCFYSGTLIPGFVIDLCFRSGTLMPYFVIDLCFGSGTLMLGFGTYC